MEKKFAEFAPIWSQVKSKRMARCDLIMLVLSSKQLDLQIGLWNHGLENM